VADNARYEIQQIMFEPAGQALHISYVCVPDDIRVQGAVVMQRQVRLAAGHPDYADDIEGLHSRVVRILRSALEDFEASEPFDPDEDEDEDDERGMGE
jgi:hypothetical protein